MDETSGRATEDGPLSEDEPDNAVDVLRTERSRQYKDLIDRNTFLLPMNMNKGKMFLSSMWPLCD